MTEIRLFGIKTFDSKDRGDVIIVGLLVLPLMMSFLGTLGGGGTYETGVVVQQACYSGPINEYNYMWATAGMPDCPGIAEERTTIRTQIESPTPKSVPDYKKDADVILANIDPEIHRLISSVNIIDRGRIQDICPTTDVACVKYIVFNGKINTADIFLIDNYGNTCYTFERALYHEIGHVEERYKYGNAASGSEYYADNFASQYANMKC